MTLLGGPRSPLQSEGQKRLVEKSTGQLFILVRDDVALTGVVHVAPVGMMTSMQSQTPEQFAERFEWYVDPKDRAVQLNAGGPVADAPGAFGTVEMPTTGVPEPIPPKNRGGRPKGSKDKKPRKRPDIAVKKEPVEVVAEEKPEETPEIINGG